MTFVLLTFFSFFPLLLVTTGALASEYAGRMACFLDGIINLGAFLCFTFTVLTGNAFAGSVLSVLCCCFIVFILEKLIVHVKADIFLCSLAMNIFFTALTSFLSYIFFNTRSVLNSPLFEYSTAATRPVTAIFCAIITAVILYCLYFTKHGLCIRISGSDSDVLEAKGICSAKYKSLAWIIAALSGSFCGCTLVLRLSSFIPSIASGRGWIALAAVFLGKKNPLTIIIAVLVFSAAEVCSSFIQNISALSTIPSSLLLALPYIVTLVMVLILPKKN